MGSDHRDLGRVSFPIWLKAVLFSVAYFVCAVVSNYLSVRGTTYVSFWLPAGLYVAVLLLNDYRAWPWLMLAALPANLAFDLLHDTKFVPILFFYCANTIQSAGGAWLVRRFVAEKPTMSSLKEFIGLLGFSAVLSTSVGGAMGAATLTAFGLSTSFAESWKVWWGSTAMAILLFSTFILAWFSKTTANRPRIFPPKKILEAMLLVATIVASCWELLFHDQGIMSPNKGPMLLPLLWAGLRFGVRGAAAASLLQSLLIAFFTTQFFKGLSPEQISSGDYVFVLQDSLAVMALVALIPAIVLSERDKRTAELRESEERFRHLTQAAFEGIAISENGRLLDVNDQCLEIFGYERKEMIGKEVIEMIAPESRATVAEAIRTGQESIYEHRLLRKDGSFFYGEARAKVVRMGNQTLRMTALRDITERKQAEQALRESEAHFRAIFENAAIGVSLADLKGRLVRCNPALQRLLGYSESELQGMNFTELTHAGDVEADLQLYRALVAGECDEYQIEKRYLRKDGQSVWVRLTVSLVRPSGGEPQFAIGIVEDIAARKQAEQAVRESETRLRMLTDASFEGIGVCQDGIIVDANEQLMKMMGYTKSEIMGKPIIELAAPESRELVRRMTELDHTEPYEHMAIRRDGTVFPVEVCGRTIARNPHHIRVTAVRDMTERKNAEAEREQAVSREQHARAQYTLQLIASQEAERSRIAGELHDSLGQNLLIIKNRAQLALTEKSAPDDARAQLEAINTLASQAIVEVRQISHDLHPYQIGHLGLTRAIETMIDATDEASETKFQRKLDNVDECFSAEAAVNLYRIVQESLNNILKHSGAKQVRIALERDVHEILLRMEDDGCGFKASDDKSGKGLGLRNMAERVRSLRGTLKIDSQPNRGTCIEVTIPIAEEKCL